jgi:hypothetical protein
MADLGRRAPIGGISQRQDIDATVYEAGS